MSVLKRSQLGSDSRLYQIWAGIKTRCYNANSPNYKNYGLRGIEMCDEWHEYPVFEKWALANGYKVSTEKKFQYIERIDNNGNYSPDNCIWTTAKEQMNNTRRNVYIEYKGMRKTLAQWANYYQMNYSTFLSRYSRGWSMDKISNTPIHKHERRT